MRQPFGRVVPGRLNDAWVDYYAADHVVRRSVTSQHVMALAREVRESRAEIERLRAALDEFIAEVDGDHQPEWASEQAKAAGKEPWCCQWCGPQDGSWPCSHRRALDELKDARRG